ncbi:MAG TPA: hypothetical protein V6D27_09130 [Vampirovibrionales bacterium]
MDGTAAVYWDLVAETYEIGVTENGGDRPLPTQPSKCQADCLKEAIAPDAASIFTPRLIPHLRPNRNISNSSSEDAIAFIRIRAVPSISIGELLLAHS